jgi:hypothetical protein
MNSISSGHTGNVVGIATADGAVRYVTEMDKAAYDALLSRNEGTVNPSL